VRYAALFLFLLAPALACVLDPTWAVPATPPPGGAFEIRAESPVKEVYAIANGTEVRLPLVPGGARAELPPGLYDLKVVTEGGTCYQHNALWVVPEGLSSLYVMHLTDEHFGVYTDRWAYQYVLAAVFIANSLPVQAIFVTGDIADTAMEVQYEKAALVHGLSLKPVFAVPGNHDHVNPSEPYPKMVGPYVWKRRAGEVLLVGLDTGGKGYLSYSQALKAYEMLKDNAKVKVVLFHHPFIWGAFGVELDFNSFEEFYQSIAARAYRSWFTDPEGFKKFLEAIYYNNVTATFSGHVHVDECARGKGFWAVVTTTTGGPVREGDYRGFRLAEVGEAVETSCEGRHQSYSLEGAYAQLGSNSKVSAVIFKISDEKLINIMPKVVLAVPVPFEEYEVYAPGATEVWKRCSPAFCAVYASFEPQLGKTYRLAVYTEPDEEPPEVLDLSYPEAVEVGKPIPISFKARDDSWGIANATVAASGPGYSLNVMVASYGGSYRLQAPPPEQPGTIKFSVVLEDYYGHRTVKQFEVEVRAREPAQQQAQAPPQAVPALPAALLLLLLLGAALLLLI